MGLENSGGFRSRAASSGSQRPAQQKRRSTTQPPKKAKAARPAKAARNRKGDRVAAVVAAGVDKARAVAFDALLTVITQDAYANLVLPKSLRAHRLTGRDAAFATELTYGALRSLGIIDAVVDDVSSRPTSTMDAEVLAALRLGAYQVLFTRVEPHAAVDTTVRIVEGVGQDKAKGFANGIMRSITRTSPERWLEMLAPSDDLAALAFRTSHPEWIARSFSQVLATGELEEALRHDSERPKVHLVARPGEISAEELALISGGEEGAYSPYAVYLDGGDPGAVEPVRQGLAAVQDEGSQIIARAVTVAPVSGEDQGKWLDLCAGPGGKAALLGGLARFESAHVDAVEVTPHRAELIKNATRDLPVTVHVADGRCSGLNPGFDRILVDAPCSGLGALRRRPEARWRKQESDIAGLATLQFELLSAAVELARPGGVIVYSTCSPDLRETREIVDKAVAELGVTELNAHEFACGMQQLGDHKSVQMWPHRHGTDAMFFAVLTKPAS